jgi:hypothetical protein
MTREESVLYVSGQAWKLWAMIGGTFASVVLIFGAYTFRASLSPGWYQLTMWAGILAGLFSLAFPVLSIRCPSCRARWFWLAISMEHGSRWYEWLVSRSSCPVCGASGAAGDLSNTDGRVRRSDR